MDFLPAALRLFLDFRNDLGDGKVTGWLMMPSVVAGVTPPVGAPAKSKMVEESYMYVSRYL